MEAAWRELLWGQFGAALDMLENAIRACPDEVWFDRTREPRAWYVAYHTLFFLDLYCAGGVEGFRPPEPFTLGELNRGVVPAEPYAKDQLLAYLDYGRERARAMTAALDEASLRQSSGFAWLRMNRVELALYNARHVQHHAAQLNLILRQTTGSVPGWVRRTRHPLA